MNKQWYNASDDNDGTFFDDLVCLLFSHIFQKSQKFSIW